MYSTKFTPSATTVPMDLDVSAPPKRDRKASAKMAEAASQGFTSLATSFSFASPPITSSTATAGGAGFSTREIPSSIFDPTLMVSEPRTFGDIYGYPILSSIPELNTYVVDERFKAEFEANWKKHLPSMLDYQSKEVRKFPHLRGKFEQTDLLLETINMNGIPGIFDLVEVRPSPGKGFGVFTKGKKDEVVIPEDTIVGIYSGVITKYPTTRSKASFVRENGYLFQLELFGSDEWCVDAKPCGSFTRFFNHAPFGSKAHTVQPIIYITPDGPVIAFYATADIYGDTELSFCYGKGYLWQEPPK